MPNTRSAYRQLKKSRKRAQRNKAVRSELKTRIKKMKKLLAENKLQEAEEYFRIVEKRLMQAASKNIIHKNKASRHISRLHTLLNQARNLSTN
ncbi:MAG TPA: 30S ribosomal protein S20 [Candidatus Omnitrophica bacterium]|nr:30S ribosomal protein S20 [Candidatus Omnitrophota bacterium]